MSHNQFFHIGPITQQFPATAFFMNWYIKGLVTLLPVTNPLRNGSIRIPLLHKPNKQQFQLQSLLHSYINDLVTS